MIYYESLYPFAFRPIVLTSKEFRGQKNDAERGGCRHIADFLVVVGQSKP